MAKSKLGNLILFLDRVVNLYLYYVVLACFIILIPNINPNYPLFHTMFTFAGFYLIPPIFGISFSPMAMLILPTLISMGLRKIYLKYFAKDEPKIVVLTKEEFEKSFPELKKEEKNDDNL
jgi:uncharacterized protein YggT (Ycf19 family)